MQKAMNFNDVAIVSVKENDYKIQLWYTSKDGAINILNDTYLSNKRDRCKNICYIYV